MSLYTIAQLAELSGIKPHTIRIWEKRYNLLEPERTDTNIRRYDDSQLRRLLNTVSLLNNGFKISKIATYSEKEINDLIDKKIEEQKATDFTAEVLINQMFTSGLAYNEADFEKAFSSAILRFGVNGTYIKVVYPLLVRAGYMWLNTSLSPCQEHFITNIIKRKFFTALDSIPLPQKPKHRWVLFLPENEYHEIGLLFAYYLLRTAGHLAIYLGGNVPYDELKRMAIGYNPTHLLFFSVHRLPKNTLQRYIKKIETDFKKTSIILAADKQELKLVKAAAHVKLISSVEQFEEILSTLN